MKAIDVIREAERSHLVDEDGDPVELSLSPGLSAENVDALVARLGFKPPAELVELLAECSGLEGMLGTVDFTGESEGFEYEAVFPRCIPIAHDGFGNFWVLDVSPEGAAVAPVFFACHDAPVVLYQSSSLAEFLAEVVNKYRPARRSLVDDVHEDRLFDIWRKNPGTMTVSEAAQGDPVLQDFAKTLDERFTVVDLRNPKVGMGFSWGRYGDRTEVRRFGDELLFAYAAPVGKGLWARLTGR